MPRIKRETERKVYNLLTDLVVKIHELQDAKSAKYEQDIITMAINELYDKTFNYAYVAKTRLEGKISKANMTPEEKAKAEIELADAKQTAKVEKAKQEKITKIEEGANICLQLGGKEFLDSAGERKCEYYTYGWLNTKNAWVTKQTRYLHELTEDDIEYQYYNDSTDPREAMPPDQVIATLVDLGITDNKGKPLA